MTDFETVIRRLGEEALAEREALLEEFTGRAEE